MAVTFTTRAAGEMRTRLRSLGAGGVQARTFHSAALRQARFFWPRVYGGELPVLTESKLGLMGNAARRNRVQTDQATLRDLASEVEWAKVSNVRPDDYPRIAEAPEPGPHLTCRAGGEGDREDFLGVVDPGGDAVGDPVRDRPGLAGAGAREDADRSAQRLGDPPLLGIERIQQGIGVGHAGNNSW